MSLPPKPAPICQAFDLAGGFKVEFRFTRPDLLAYEITPTPAFDTPAAARAFLADYIKARRQFLEIVATVTGLTLAVVDTLPDDSQAIGQPIAPANPN